MPNIFDNIEKPLRYELRRTLDNASRADFCVGYFNLRGWKTIDSLIDNFKGIEESRCRVLIGMQSKPQDELREALSPLSDNGMIDNQTALRLKQEAAREFRDQLVVGTPSNEDEATLRRLSRQLKRGKVVVKLHTKHRLHAKLYIIHRDDHITPIVSYLGSSNLTFSGLQGQGELNVDVVEQDAAEKLQRWFDDRWEDRFSIDISKDLAEIIDASWAREGLIPPYYIYLKIAYRLSREARIGLADFKIPKEFAGKLFGYQAAAVQIAAHHLSKRKGVMIGDVVGLGKTLMATALAKINEIDTGHSTLIICPKNLEGMWNDHRLRYGLSAEVVPISMVERRLADIPARFRLVLIDESHNLRNREGKRYRAIQEYIRTTDSRCIMLTATPYNKSYVDLGNQLRLFVNEHEDLGIRPENYIRAITETEFIRKHQAPVRSLAAFEHSTFADDWRELMRLFLIRRTRSFIEDVYADEDPETGRKFLTFGDGRKSYFPTRTPKTLKFEINEQNPDDVYARMFAPGVVDAINRLNLPRYGLGNYVKPNPSPKPTAAQQETLQGLARAGRRLMGFSRTNLFKRLESSGSAFIQSVDRHILRNFIYIHAVENGLPVPIGTQDIGLLDPAIDDEDPDIETPRLSGEDRDEQEQDASTLTGAVATIGNEDDHRRRAAEVYEQYATRYRSRFKWLPAELFVDQLRAELLADSRNLLGILQDCGPWDAGADEKLNALLELLRETHPDEKVIVFSQFADTVRYLTDQLQARHLEDVAGVSGDSADPTRLAERFSPVSNNKRGQIAPEDELRVLISTDVLSEGQNLQDAAIVVNYDLPWAIIRLIQRAGRVDRIGQDAEEILCYSFLPADGVERIINLRGRIMQRLRENAEVVGTDEAFFEDGDRPRTLLDLYHEKSVILNDEDDREIDLGSQALKIWQRGIQRDPRLAKRIPDMADVVFSTREDSPTGAAPEGVLLYMRTADDNDALALVGKDGEIVTQSQQRILEIAACDPETPAIPRHARHHELVDVGVKHLLNEEHQIGGQLGGPRSIRFRVYERLKNYQQEIAGQIFDTPELRRAIQQIYDHPLRPLAIDTLGRQLRSGIDDQKLAEMVVELREDDRLSLIHDQPEIREPRVICSMGLFGKSEGA